MAAQTLLFKHAARAQMLDGVHAITRAVRGTLGPRGRPVPMRLKGVEGMKLDRGYISPYFVTSPETMTVVLENAYVLLHEKPIHAMRELLPLLQLVSEQDRPILVIAENVDGEALATLIVNRVRGTLACAAIKAPGSGERRRQLLDDLALLTGGQVLGSDPGLKLENASLLQLGRARKITIDRDHTLIVAGEGEQTAIEGRCQQKARLEDARHAALLPPGARVADRA